MQSSFFKLLWISFVFWSPSDLTSHLLNVRVNWFLSAAELCPALMAEKAVGCSCSLFLKQSSLPSIRIVGLKCTYQQTFQKYISYQAHMLPSCALLFKSLSKEDWKRLQIHWQTRSGNKKVDQDRTVCYVLRNTQAKTPEDLFLQLNCLLCIQFFSLPTIWLPQF